MISLLLLWAALAGAVSLETTPAFDGRAVYGAAGALAVDVIGEGSDWKGRVEIPSETSLFSVAVEVPAGGRKRLWVAAPEALRPEHVARAVGSDGTTVEKAFRLAPIDGRGMLVAVLSEENPPMGALAGLPSPSGMGTVQTITVRPEDLPPFSTAFDAVSAVFATRWRPASLEPEQARALGLWVARGGFLLISADPELSRLKASWLERLLPARVTGDAALPVLQTLALHAGMTHDGRDAEPWAAKLEPVEGAQTVLSAGGSPLLVCKRHGLGRVCLLAVELSEPAVYAHPGWPLLSLELLGLYAAPVFNDDENWQNLQASYARGLEESLKRVSLPKLNPAPVFLGFFMLYAAFLLLGAYRWYRKRGREEQTWQGVLAVAAVFCVAGWVIGKVGGGTSATTQLYVAVAAPGGDTARYTGWIARFSDSRRRWSLAVPPETENAAELRTQAGAAAGSIKEAGAFELERRAGKANLTCPMESGQVRYFRLDGDRALGEGMELSLSGGELRWSNKTGLSFDALWTMTPGAVPVSAAQGASGALDLSTGTFSSFVPEGLLSGEEQNLLSLRVQQARERCPACVLAAGFKKEGEAGWVYLWPVAGRAETVKNLYLDPQPRGRSWSVWRRRLSLNAGSMMVAAPARVAAGLRLKLMMNGVNVPTVEVFDWKAGRWLAESAPPSEGVEEKRLPEARQAALLVTSLGPRAALITPSGRLLVTGLTRAAPVVVDQGVEPDFPPSLAEDGSGKLNLLYRKAGRLVHAREPESGPWKSAALPDSQGATHFTLSWNRDRLHAAFYSGARGLVAGEREAEAWKLDTIFAGAASLGALSLCSSAGDPVLWAHRDSRVEKWSKPAGRSWFIPEVYSVAPLEHVSLSGCSAAVYREGGTARFMEAGRRDVRYFHGGTIWRGKPVFAAASGPEGWAWLAGFDETGAVDTTSQHGQRQMPGISGARPPFRFAVSGRTAYYLYGAPGGAVLRARPELLTGARHGGPATERVARFKGPGLTWGEAGLARFRLTASLPVSIEQLWVEDE